METEQSSPALADDIEYLERKLLVFNRLNKKFLDRYRETNRDIPKETFLDMVRVNPHYYLFIDDEHPFKKDKDVCRQVIWSVIDFNLTSDKRKFLSIHDTIKEIINEPDNTLIFRPSDELCMRLNFNMRAFDDIDYRSLGDLLNNDFFIQEIQSGLTYRNTHDYDNVRRTRLNGIEIRHANSPLVQEAIEVENFLKNKTIEYKIKEKQTNKLRNVFGTLKREEKDANNSKNKEALIAIRDAKKEAKDAKKELDEIGHEVLVAQKALKIAIKTANADVDAVRNYVNTYYDALDCMFDSLIDEYQKEMFGETFDTNEDEQGIEFKL